jgi:hypothetical protein
VGKLGIAKAVVKGYSFVAIAALVLAVDAVAFFVLRQDQSATRSHQNPNVASSRQLDRS